jgi:pilus assembly protein CpaE
MTDYDFSNFDSSFDDPDSGLAVAEPESPVSTGSGVAVVDGDNAVRDYLVGLFEQPVNEAADLIEMEHLLTGEACVVVLGPSCATPEHMTHIEEWARTRPNVGTVLVTSELTTQLLHKALRVGVKDVLSAPIEREQLLETVERVAQALRPVETQTARTGATDQAAVPSGELGRVISIFSTKGGSGKSVTATNLAVTLARNCDRPVVLVDGHLQFGDVAVMLKLYPETTVVDAVAQMESVDSEMLREIMTLHEPSGLLVLAAPAEPTFADQISGAHMARLIEVIRTFAAYVVVDLPAIFSDVVLNVIEASDEIVLVAGLDIPNIKNVKIGFSTLSLLNVPKERLHLLLNRADSKVKLDVSEVERSLGIETAAHVPSDVVVPISVNKGSPVVLSAPKSNVARAFEQLAARFLEGPVSSASGQSQGLRKFFG